jgi:hypothetical protein
VASAAWQPDSERPRAYQGQRMHTERVEKTRAGEPSLPAAVAVIAAIVLYAGLPNGLLLGSRYVLPGLELILFVPLMLASPRRMSRQNRLLRRLSIALLLLIALSNLAVLVLLVRSPVIGEAKVGEQLLGAAGQVWLTNVLVFALAYWEIDSGGPVSRARVRRTGLPAADFRVPQDGEALDPQTRDRHVMASGPGKCWPRRCHRSHAWQPRTGIR